MTLLALFSPGPVWPFHNGNHNVMIFVMKLRCKACKKSFPRPDRGRRPIYCSAACRQRAYRKREAEPHRKLKLLAMSDIYKIRDQTARCRAAVKVLEEAGYEVELLPRGSSRKKPRPNLKVVRDNGEEPLE